MQQRRFAIGAEVQLEGGVDFRLWAPQCRRVDLALKPEGGECQLLKMERETEGYFSLTVESAHPRMLYGFQLDGRDEFTPDPASRYQPQGPFGFSQIIDPHAFIWSDRSWRGCRRKGHVIYEMHVGTFTFEGTWKAACGQLAELKDLGITLVEMMPVAEFPGEFGWGYDGVDLFAPYHCYGQPDDLREFVNRAHELEIGVILDVVYNHLGPSGNFLSRFSQNYFSDRYKNEWGRAINLDGPESKSVREFFIENARYWIEEFHFDGLRLDATQCLFDQSPRPFMTELSEACRRAAASRPILLIAENEPQLTKTIKPAKEKGYGFDMMWNDDFHHSWRVALTGKREAYYVDYKGTVEELALLSQWGFLYQGQFNARQGKYRGSSSLSMPAEQLIVYLQNHDQVANSATGHRLQNLTSSGLLKAGTTALLLLPSTPMLFQGQEFGTSRPFLYFADHKGELAELVSRGRRDFLSQFASHKAMEKSQQFREPCVRETFTSCRLDFSERDGPNSLYRLHKDLIRLRKEDAVLREQSSRHLAAATVGHEALAFRFFGRDEGDRLLVINLGKDLSPGEVHPHPLLVSPSQRGWELMLATEFPEYGGSGVAAPDENGEWSYLAQSAYFFRSQKEAND